MDSVDSADSEKNSKSLGATPERLKCGVDPVRALQTAHQLVLWEDAEHVEDHMC